MIIESPEDGGGWPPGGQAPKNGSELHEGLKKSLRTVIKRELPQHNVVRRNGSSTPSILMHASPPRPCY